jgi:hypothetical protein
MKKIIFIITSLLFVSNLLFAGDKEDIIKQIKDQWVDFSKKKMDMSLINPNGAWQARSDGGLWDFQSPKEIKSQIEVSIVGKNKDVAYTSYYLVGSITGPGNKLIASNYRTRASSTLIKNKGKWVAIGQHFSPLYGGSGVVFD